ncbi:MAG TPA: AarF/UbiB family protein [Kofleriaceae bacterium]|nr:AarF/UbiB family protein [Kofleriaceae bacterium]
MLRLLRFFLRGLAVALIMLGQFLIWLIGWLLLLLTFRGKARRQAWFADRMRASLVSLGATFVKVGQIMSTRPDLLPPHIIAALSHLQDNVGAFAYRHVERTFREELGRPPAELFTTFDPVPIASASVAQVHRAELPDGRAVAVKVRRPGLEHIVAFDLRVMRLVAWFVSLVPSLRLLAPVESVDEFGRAIRAQIDLQDEARNNQRFRANFAGNRDVDFPELVPALCTRRILTMSFIEGAKVLEVDRAAHDPVRLARVGFRTLLQMVFHDGFVHADLHPGNILVTAAGTVVILDLGLIAELSDADRTAFARYFAGWASGDGKVMARLMADLSPSARVPDYPAYEADVVAFATRYLGKKLAEVQVSAVALDMMNILRRHRVRVNPTYTVCNIAIAVTEGIGKQLAPDLDLMVEALPFFMGTDTPQATT